MSPPTRSTVREMSRRRARRCPLNSRCSRKWLTPDSSAGSSREPTATQTPIATDLAAGTRSVAIVKPVGQLGEPFGHGTMRHRSAEHAHASAVAAPAAIAAAAVAATVAAAVTAAPVARAVRALASGPRSPTSLRSSASKVSSNETLTTSPRRSAVARRRLPSARRRRAPVRRRRPTGVRLTLPLSSISSTRTSSSWPSESTSSTALIRLPPAELGDVHEAVAAREDVDERAELGDVDDPAVVHGAELGLGRVDDGQDGRLGLLHPPALDGADGDDALRPVVVDADVGAGLGLDRVDDLALGADDLADLVDRDDDRGDLGRRRGDLVARCRRSRRSSPRGSAAGRPWPGPARRVSTSAGMPSIFVSSCSAVTASAVPATLKSMSPKASSAPRMSVSVVYVPPS